MRTNPTAAAVALAAAMLATSVPVPAADVEGAADHPLISRYPGQEIAAYEVENHRIYKLPLGPVTGYRAIDEVTETAGRVTRIFYAYRGQDRTHTEIWKNYADALAGAGFEILASGAPTDRTAKNEVGGRSWFGVALGLNPWSAPGTEVGTLYAGSSTSGGSAAVIARKERAAGTAYVAVYVEQHSEDLVGTLVDIVEVEAAETGLVSVDAEAIGQDLQENGRVVLTGLHFDFDTADLRAESRPTLAEIARYLREHPERRFYVVGHTDAKGTFSYNAGLSRDRARAVVDALVEEHGIAADQLEPHGVGPLVPVFSNASDAGRERNRRVELVERQAG
jgi:outer membrane protein OmpA-like peptidoglycan-associated protein